MKPYILLAIMIISFTAVIFLGGYFVVSQYLQDAKDQQNNQQQASLTPSPTPADATAGWNTLNNSDWGFSLKYPTDFGTKYASFQSDPIATVTTNGSDFDAQGCLRMADGSPSKKSTVTINNIQFCLVTTSSPGAGQLYNSYNYTTLKNGNYYTLQYVVHTLNGCSPYTNTPDYQPCTDFMNNYNNNVTQLIEKSVSTFQFTK